jgi:hypothetical protein
MCPNTLGLSYGFEFAAMPRKNILALLEGGDRRMIGRAGVVAAMVSRHAERFPKLIAGLWSTDPLVRMRAADTTEKVTRKNPALLQPYKKELLKLMIEAQEQELRWHLAVIVPRLPLNAKERTLAISSLHGYLQDRSSIVKTCALQGLADLARNDPKIRPRIVQMISRAARSGTPAMKARSRKLLIYLGRA